MLPSSREQRGGAWAVDPVMGAGCQYCGHSFWPPGPNYRRLAQPRTPALGVMPSLLAPLLQIRCVHGLEVSQLPEAMRLHRGRCWQLQEERCWCHRVSGIPASAWFIGLWIPAVAQRQFCSRPGWCTLLSERNVRCPRTSLHSWQEFFRTSFLNASLLLLIITIGAKLPAVCLRCCGFSWVP
jgi:hypothetical protein